MGIKISDIDVGITGISTNTANIRTALKAKKPSLTDADVRSISQFATIINGLTWYELAGITQAQYNTLDTNATGDYIISGHKYVNKDGVVVPGQHSCTVLPVLTVSDITLDTENGYVVLAANRQTGTSDYQIAKTTVKPLFSLGDFTIDDTNVQRYLSTRHDDQQFSPVTIYRTYEQLTLVPSPLNGIPATDGEVASGSLYIDATGKVCCGSLESIHWGSSIGESETIAGFNSDTGIFTVPVGYVSGNQHVENIGLSTVSFSVNTTSTSCSLRESHTTGYTSGGNNNLSFNDMYPTSWLTSKNINMTPAIVKDGYNYLDNTGVVQTGTMPSIPYLPTTGWVSVPVSFTEQTYTATHDTVFKGSIRTSWDYGTIFVMSVDGEVKVYFTAPSEEIGEVDNPLEVWVHKGSVVTWQIMSGSGGNTLAYATFQ